MQVIPGRPTPPGAELFDQNADGVISDKELAEGAANLRDAVKLNTLLKRMIIVVLIAAALTIVSLSAVIVFTVRDSVQFKDDDKNVMVSSSTGEEVQCASTNADLFLQNPVYVIDVGNDTVNSGRRLQSGYCGSVDCDDEISALISQGYVHVASQSASQTFSQLSVIKSYGQKVASISLSFGPSSSGIEIRQYYATQYFVEGVEGAKLTKFKALPVEAAYRDEAYFIFVPPICEDSPQSSDCISPILRSPFRNSSDVAGGRRLARRLSRHENPLIASESPLEEIEYVSTLLTCQEAYELFEKHVHAPKSQTQPLSVQYDGMDLTVSVRVKRHLHQFRNASLVRIDVMDTYFADEDYEGEVSCNGLLHPSDDLCSECSLVTKVPRLLVSSDYWIPDTITCNCDNSRVAGSYYKECEIGSHSDPCYECCSECFSASQTVEKDTGELIPISEVKVGDRILSVNSVGEKVFSDVVYVPHLFNENERLFISLTISTTPVPLLATANHFIFASPCADQSDADNVDDLGWGASTLVKMSEITSGMCIQTATGGLAKVLSVGSVKEKGMYTVVTNEEYIVVNGVIASPFANSHLIPHIYYNLHRLLYKLSPSILNSPYLRQFNDALGGLAAFTLYLLR
jgi:hypothetical protein